MKKEKKNEFIEGYIEHKCQGLKVGGYKRIEDKGLSFKKDVLSYRELKRDFLKRVSFWQWKEQSWL